MHMAWQTFFAVTFRLRNTIIPLILPIDDLGFANEDVRIMADESSPWDSPTKDNIVSPCVNVRCYSYPYISSDRSNEDVGSWCPTQRLLISLLSVIMSPMRPCIDGFLFRIPLSFRPC